jgi:DinB family protein
MTRARAAELADSFVATNQEVIAFARSCSDEQWQTLVPGEDWPVSVVIHHIAEGHANARAWLETMVKGEEVTTTLDEIHGRNAEHAARSADVSIDEAVALLESNGSLMASLLRGLTDEDLVRTAPFGPADGRALPVEQMAAVTAKHAQGHLAHARDALAG